MQETWQLKVIFNHYSQLQKLLEATDNLQSRLSHFCYNLGSKPEAKKSVQLFLLLWRLRPPYRTSRKFPNPHTGRGKHFTLWLSAYNTLGLRMLLSSFSSDQCQHFGPGGEWPFPGDLAQEHCVSICLPKDLCRDVKNQK